MFELLEKGEKLLRLWNKIVEWLKHRYVIESSIALPRTVALPFWHRFLALNSHRIISDALFVLTFATLSRYVLAYKYFATTLTTGATSAFPLVLEVLVYFASLLIAVSALGLILRGLLRDRLFLLRSALVFLCILAINYLFRDAKPVLYQFALGKAYRNAVNLFEEEKYSEAKRIFERLLQQKEMRVAPREVLEAYVAGGYYHEGSYREAMNTSCRILGEYSSLNPELREDVATTLHWSIYGLAQTTEFSLADDLLNETRGKYGSFCIIESSPYWLAISPELWSYIDVAVDEFEWFGLRDYQDFIESEQNQGRGDAEHLWRYTRDLDRMKYLLEEYPREKYAEHCLYLLGEYDVILTEYRGSLIRHLALYARGVQAFEEGSYRDAISYFEQFLSEFPSHKWADSTYWRISRSYFLLGDKRKALHYVLLAKSVSDGIPWNLTSETVYLLDVHMTSTEIQQFISENTIYGFDDLLEFSLAEKLMEEARWDQAALELETIVRKYSGSRVALYAEDDLKMLRDISSTISNYGKTADFYLGKVFYYSDDLVFYNELWQFNRYDTLVQYLAPESYYWRNNDYLRAAELFYAFAFHHPNHPLAEESLFMAGKSYEMAVVTGFLADKDMIARIRRKAVDTYREHLGRYMDLNRERTDEAIQSLGLIWLHKMEYSPSILYLYNHQELEQMRAEFSSFVDDHPSHNLANNMLNWIGWSYCLEANLYPLESVEYQNYYLKAFGLYNRIAQDYPLGLTSLNAQENIQRISEKLNDPSPVEEDRWYWYGYGEIGYFQDRECFYVPPELDKFIIRIRRFEDIPVNVFNNDGVRITEADANVSVHTQYDELREIYEDLYRIQYPQPGFCCIRGAAGHFAVSVERVP